ncbi:MAG: phenylalanine--tRNA ligase subunit alpha [Candidatus Aenigmarchaeota archaeon]|nr:phenylalanine--tRNA ligase subunit alpha [Candidatus Aenigmarchaeota archaeon]
MAALEEKISQLHEHEKRIIKFLEKNKIASIDTLAKELKLSKDAVEKAVLWAKIKGYVGVKEHVKEFIELTLEGNAYAQGGLPEKKLLKQVEKNTASIEELKRRVEYFSIAIAWAKRNEWISISDGIVSITPKGKEALFRKTKEEIILSDVLRGEKSFAQQDRPIIDTLVKRGLLKLKQEGKKEVFLTEEGKKIASKIKLLKEISQITPQVLKKGEWKTAILRAYDVKLPTPKIYPAKRHFMMQIIDYIRRIWIELGFKEMTGPILDISFWNFDALFQPQDHPARDLADTFYMAKPEKGRLPSPEIVQAVKATHENGWTCNSKGWQYKWDEEIAKKCILRTHTTILSARTLAKLREDIKDGALPAKYFAVGRVFRNETVDWKHLAEFYQTEGIVVDENANFKHFLFYLKRFFSKLGFSKARFRPAYFPYTELSTEIEVWHPEHKTWLELGGAGIFRTEVVKPLLGKDIPVLAWGPGFDRIVMMNYEIKDIRELYWNDLKQLREVKVWLK